MGGCEMWPECVPRFVMSMTMMQAQETRLRPPSGHVFRVERKRGAQWYAKYRLPDGRQTQRRIGAAWTGRGRPPSGYLNKRGAELWLAETLAEARRGTLPGLIRTGACFKDAAAEFLRYIEFDRNRKPSTVRGYRAILNGVLIPAFGDVPVEEITREAIEGWLSGYRAKPSSRRKALVLMHGVLERARKVCGLRLNPAAEVEKPATSPSGDIIVYSREEIMALVKAAGGGQDGALFLTAAFTGMRRGELLALRWRDVDFAAHAIRVRASYSAGELSTPKSGKVRSVPMAPTVACVLSALRKREQWTDADDLVFVGRFGSFLEPQKLRLRYKQAQKAAGLRALRFHDLRHTFGTTVIARADIRRVQEWMGHSDIQTTMKYLHYMPREGDADLVAEAFGEVGLASSADPSQDSIDAIR
jgi:integrase